MATPSDSSAKQSAAIKSIEIRLWVKRIAYAILAVIIVALSTGQLKSYSKTGGSEWVTVARVTCSPAWNQDRGWCPVVTDAAKGTYRVVPRYKSWQLWQNDGNFIAVPPHGLDIYAYWKDHEEFIDEFHRTAHKKDRNNYGALVIRIGDTEVIEALNSSRNPREFEVTENGTEIAITVNLTPLLNFYQYNRGEITVEVQRQD